MMGIWDWEAIDIDRYMSFGEDVDISTCFFLEDDILDIDLIDIFGDDIMM
jgi:hypothetical protein